MTELEEKIFMLEQEVILKSTALDELNVKVYIRPIFIYSSIRFEHVKSPT